MARATLLDLAKLNPDQLVQGIIEEAIAASLELKVAIARFIPGTEYRTVVRTGLPSTGFRDANQGVEPTMSTFENRPCKCHILAARVEADKAVADAYVDGPEHIKHSKPWASWKQLIKRWACSSTTGRTSTAKASPA